MKLTINTTGESKTMHRVVIKKLHVAQRVLECRQKQIFNWCETEVIFLCPGDCCCLGQGQEEKKQKPGQG